MPFNPDNDDLVGQWDDLDPEEIPRCRHGVALAFDGSSRDCEDCNEQIGQSQAISADAAWPYASNH